MQSMSNSSSISQSEFKRLILIGIQIKNLLDELTQESEEVKVKFQNAVEEKLIKSFTFYAVKAGLSYAELEVVIDWNEYQNQINKGNLIIKTKSKNGVLSPTKNIATKYKQYADRNGFSIVWQFSFANHVDIAKARKKLNSSPAGKIVHATSDSDFVSRQYEVGELTELTYIMKL